MKEIVLVPVICIVIAVVALVLFYFDGQLYQEESDTILATPVCATPFATSTPSFSGCE